MQHNTFMGKRLFLERLCQRLHPGRIVNLCFIIVLIFSTLLTWREVVVLEDAYFASQRNHLANITSSLDRQLQFSVDKLIFFRHGMLDALHTPLALSALQSAATRFGRLRDDDWWQLFMDMQRTLPLKGVSDDFVRQTTLLNRDNERLNDEITAALEVGYLLRLSSPPTRLAQRAIYVSRAGFYLDTLASASNHDIVSRYYRFVTSPWFMEQSQRANRSRSVRWFTSPQASSVDGEPVVTASVPVDYQDYWYGVLSMDFAVSSIQKVLHAAIEEGSEGEYQLYDSRLQMITSSGQRNPYDRNTFDEVELAKIAAAVEADNEGGLRLGSRYVSWERLDHFDGLLLRIHTLQEGVHGDFGSISIALALLWVLFTAMLLISWLVIRRMVSNMYSLQNSLQWQAWYDPLTRLHNRGALFERAKTLAEECCQQKKPFSVIQLDLDYFKGINDRFGHQAGDRVLSHTGGLIAGSLRIGDVAGRVGGEEFCVVLPGATLDQAGKIAERIRAHINSKEILVKKSTTIRVSASLGVSSAQEDDNYDFEQLQSVADIRLYQAKQQGRNQVVTQDGEREKK